MRLTQVVAGLAILAAGGGIILLLQSTGVIPVKEKPLQVTGDPPITIGDGSLHAHSTLNGWSKDKDKDDIKMTPQIIHPAPENGSLQTSGCEYNGQHMQGTDINGKTNDASAIFWADDHEPWDISPANNGTTTVIITQQSGDGQQATITITAPTNGQLSIEPQYPTEFHKDKDQGKGKAPHNREHNYQGEVMSIAISGSNHDTPQGTPWKPVNPMHPHYTLGFCYK